MIISLHYSNYSNIQGVREFSIFVDRKLVYSGRVMVMDPLDETALWLISKYVPNASQAEKLPYRFKGHYYQITL